MRRKFVFVLIVISELAAPFAASAQTATRLATQDTWINNLSSTTVHGADTALGLCPSAPYWAYLKFDLNGLPGDVVSAELRMTRFSGDRPEEISVFLIQQDSWTEATLTGATRPAPTDPLDATQLAVGQSTANGYDRWVSANLTSAVRQEAGGDRTISLLVRENYIGQIDIRYYRSREAAVSDANKPQLVLTLAPFEVSSLVLDDAAPAALRWTSEGAGIVYDIVTGSLSALRADAGVSAASCLTSGVTTSAYNDFRADPSPGAGDYYLVRGRSACCPGTYGFASSAAERVPVAACP